MAATTLAEKTPATIKGFKGTTVSFKKKLCLVNQDDGSLMPAKLKGIAADTKNHVIVEPIGGKLNGRSTDEEAVPFTKVRQVWAPFKA
jgi:hypothetical protein